VGDYWHFHFSSIHWLWFETFTLAFFFLLAYLRVIRAVRKFHLSHGNTGVPEYG
jgi:hypothetical protein